MKMFDIGSYLPDLIMMFTIFLMFLVAIISMAAIIYPFKPFYTRKFAVLVLITDILVIGALTPSPDDFEDPVVVSTEITGADGPIPTTETQNHPVESQFRRVRTTFERGQWVQTAVHFRSLAQNSFDYEEIAKEIEEKVLDIVRPLPASDHAGNLRGYRLLLAIRPESNVYAAKVDDYTARIVQAREAAVSRLRQREDRIEGVTWYSHPNQPRFTNSRSTTYLYIGRRTHARRPWLRMRVQYKASTWLFVERVTAWYDGNRVSLISGDFERDNNTTIWEWLDVAPTSQQINILRSLSTANEAILRFHGQQYHRDATLSAGDKRAIRDVLLAYEAMQIGG